MAAPADRLFYSFPAADAHATESAGSNSDKLLKYVRDNVIGSDKVFSGPFGLRKVTYLDYTASGRSLEFIEDYIRKEVLPEYGNTHTTTSITSLQTTLFRHEARDIIRNSVKASEHDSVIFVGSGCTAAVHKLIHALDLQTAPVVFVGPFEHHSNLLPWMELGAEVVRIGLSSDGGVDLQQLEAELKSWQTKGRQLLGCFSAASNITGVLTDVNAVTVLLHRHGALAFWDYATAAPYVDIDMNPVVSGVDQPYVYKDAVFLSTHKFVGGVSTPGVLIAKKKLFKNTVPDGCGGGSVFFVRREGHRYLQEPELKEEGGTPAIVEAIRAGLVFQLKDAIASSTIMQREHQLARQAFAAWSGVKELVLLGTTGLPRLPIFSFLVHHPPSNRFLHHNFVAALLNDVFGIQARGGCACAGPYAMDVLGLNEETAVKFENLLVEDKRLDRTHLRRYREYSHREILRPGFVRLNLPYFMDQDSLEFVLAAVAMVAREGWKMLPQYMFNPETGEWRQKNFQVFKDRKWLNHVSYQSGEMRYRVPAPIVKGPLPASHQECLEMAQDLFRQASKKPSGLPDQSLMFDAEAEEMRWFLLPSEAEACLHGNSCSPLAPEDLPFCPPALRCQLQNDTAATGKPKSAGTTQPTSQSRDATPEITSPSNLPSRPVNRGEKGTDVSTKCSAATKSSAELSGSSPEGTDSDSRLTAGSIALHTGEQEADGEGCDNQETLNQMCVLHTVGLHEKNGPTAARNCCESPLDSQTSAREEQCCTKNCGQTLCPSSMNGVASCDSQAFPVGMVRALERGYCGTLPASSLDGCDVTDSVSPSHNDVLTAHASPASTLTERSSSSLNGEVAEPSVQSADSSQRNHAEHDDSCAVNGCPESDTPNTANTAVDSRGTKNGPNSTSSTPQPAAASKRPKKKKQKKGKSEACSLQCAPSLPENSASSAVPDSQTGPQWKWFSPPKCIFKPTVQAVEEYGMLQDGDRVLVCLSGGKDSLSLLHTMHQLQFYCRGQGLNFELGAVTVDPQTAAYDPRPLKGYLASLGVPYFYESQGILETAISLPSQCASICSFCSRMKRGRIYAAARREGYNVLALGQHLDDLSESFLMSFFHNGSMRTMKAHYTVQNNDLRVIRPFVYVREKDLRNFAEKNKLPVIAENCPACFEAPKERHRTKQLLASQELLFPRLYSSMMAAMKPLMAISRTHVNVRSLLAAAAGAGEEEEGGE